MRQPCVSRSPFCTELGFCTAVSPQPGRRTRPRTSSTTRRLGGTTTDLVTDHFLHHSSSIGKEMIKGERDVAIVRLQKLLEAKPKNVYPTET
eukprot:6116161-Pyramimonas_sp.AAC.1